MQVHVPGTVAQSCFLLHLYAGREHKMSAEAAKKSGLPQIITSDKAFRLVFFLSLFFSIFCSTFCELFVTYMEIPLILC